MKKYQIYNGYNSNLLGDYPIIEAENGANACRKFLNQIDIKFTKIKRSASNYVRIKTEPFMEKNGHKYRNGLVSWFEIWNGNSLIL